MKSHYNRPTILSLLLGSIGMGDIMGFSIQTTTGSKGTTSLLLKMVTREQYLQPHFEPPTTTASTIQSSDFDLSFEHMMECAQLGKEGCDLEEMRLMVQELERLNEKCVGSSPISDPECDVATGGARQAVIHALQLQLELDEVKQQVQNCNAVDNKQEEEERQHAIATQNMLSHMREIAEYESH